MAVAEQVLTVIQKRGIRVVIGFAVHFPFSVLLALSRCDRLQAPYYKEWTTGNKATLNAVGILCGGDATSPA
jgi:hypothetical protein